MDQSYNVKQKKADTKEYILYDFIHKKLNHSTHTICFPFISFTLIHTKQKDEVGGRRRMRKYFQSSQLGFKEVSFLKLLTFEINLTPACGGEASEW